MTPADYCRYSGRTEAELLQSEVEREEPEVHRGSSKRYPPRSDYQGDGHFVFAIFALRNNTCKKCVIELASVFD